MKGDLITDGQYKELKSRGITMGTCRKFGYTIGKYNGETVQYYHERTIHKTVKTWLISETQ